MSTSPRVTFMNIAFGGASHNIYPRDTWYPQDFAVVGRPEYGTTPPLKPADHFRGVTYGNKISLDFADGDDHLGCLIQDQTVLGLLAIPQYSLLQGLEVRVDSVFTDTTGAPVSGVTAEFKLASTGELLATVPLDVKGGTYVSFTTLPAVKYTDYGTDAIEMKLIGVPAVPNSTETFVCVPMTCDGCFGLCISAAVNFVNNAIEPNCQRPCDASPQ